MGAFILDQGPASGASNEAWHEYMKLLYYRVNIKLRAANLVRGDLKELNFSDLGISSFFADHQRVLRPKAAAAVTAGGVAATARKSKSF